MEVGARRVAPLRIGVDAVEHLSTRRLERGERLIADRAPDQQRVRRRQVDDVVIDNGAGGRAVLDTDVAVSARAVDAIVDADVVLDRAAGRASLEIDSCGHIVVDGIADHPLPRRAVVIDPVVAVVVADVVVDERVVRARVGLDTGILVVVRDVVVDDVSR